MCIDPSACLSGERDQLIRALGKRKAAVTQRSCRRGNPRDLGDFLPRVTTHHGSGDDQHHAARGGSAAGVVGDEAGKDPSCKKEAQVSVTPPRRQSFALAEPKIQRDAALQCSFIPQPWSEVSPRLNIIISE